MEGDSPPQDSEAKSTVNIFDTVMSAAGSYASAAARYVRGTSGEEDGKSKPREVRTDSDADWDKLDTPGDLDPVDGSVKQLTLENEIKELRKRIQESDQAMLKQVTNLSKREDEIEKLESQIAILKQQARDQEFKMQQLSSSTSSGDSVDSGVSGARRLQEHNKEQAMVVMNLKARIKELEETLEMTESDKSSYENLIQEAEDDKEKVKEDFENAKEEIEALKIRIDTLEHELTSTKKEAMRLSTERSTPLDECGNKKCVDVRAKLNDLEYEYEQKTDRVIRLEKVVDNQAKQIQELESAKNEAIGDIATAKMEAEIYKNDFLEERKDRERAWGELENLRKKKGGQDLVFHEERAQLYKELNGYKQENSKLKTEHAGCQAKIQHQTETSRKVIGQLKDQVERISRERDDWKHEVERTSREVIGQLKDQVEKISRERDDWKHEVERRKASKNQKIREYDKMKGQLAHATSATVKFTEQLEKVRKEKKELEKAVKRAEERARKAEKKTKVTGAQVEVLSENSAERLYEEERNRNKALQQEIDNQSDDIKHHLSTIATLKSVIMQETTALLSPTGSEKSLVSPVTHQIAGTQSDPFQGDPNYIPSDPDPQPELGLRQHLEKLNQAKQLGPSLEPFEAGMGNFQQKKQKLGPGGLSGKASNTEPHAQVMERGDNLQIAGVKSASGPQGQVRRSRADSAGQASNIPPEQQQGPPSTGGRHSTGEQPLRARGPPSQENARGPNRTLPALPQNNQPSSAKRPSTLGQYSTQPHGVGGQVPSQRDVPPHSVVRQSSQEVLRAGAKQSTDPVRVTSKPPHPPVDPRRQADPRGMAPYSAPHDGTGRPSQNPPSEHAQSDQRAQSSQHMPPRSAPYDGSGQPSHYLISEHAQSDRRAQSSQHMPPHSAPHDASGQPSQYPSGHAQSTGGPRVQSSQRMPPHSAPLDASGQPLQYPSEHAQSTGPRVQSSPQHMPPAPYSGPPDVSGQPPEAGYMNVSADMRSGRGGRSAPINPLGGHPPPSHGGVGQSQQLHTATSEGPIQRAQVGGMSQAENMTRKPLHSAQENENYANNFQEHPKAASHPIAGVPSNQSNAAASVSAKTQSVNTQTSLQFNTPIAHPPSANLATQTSVRAKDSISTQTPTEETATKGGVEQSFSENVLVERIDTDISNMAADVREEVSEKSEHIMTMEHKPFDDNLVCPMCGKRHRIGEIQKFRQHVSDCDGDAHADGSLV